MTPSRAQRLAAFEAAKKVAEEFIEHMVGNWAEVGFSDDELHRLSDAAVEAAFNVDPADNGNGS